MAITATMTVAMILRRFCAGRGSYSFASISAMGDFLYSVRLKSHVDSANATKANPPRYSRSGQIAASPTDRKSTDLKPRTEYVKGSIQAIHCSHLGKACTG